MTNTKYTPGPWVITQDNKGSLDDYCIGTGQRIDEVATCSKRDAHLIAASPELLEALEGAMDSLQFAICELKAQASIPHEDAEMMLARYESGLAAIAKAKGQTT